MSPDWSATVQPVPYAKMDNPQSLNLYSYVLNNPLSMTDPDGHEPPTRSKDCSSDQNTCMREDGVESQIKLHYAGDAMVTENQQLTLTNAQVGAAFLDVAQHNDYDPSKTGPEDPTNPGNPLYQNSSVKKASDQAFMDTQNGTARDGEAEAGFAIDYIAGKIYIAHRTNNVKSDGPPKSLGVSADPNSIAIFHTHGNHANPIPSPGDRDPESTLPNFVRSRSALYVTVPNSATGSPLLDKYIQLQ
jgi:hypothetical protein